MDYKSQREVVLKLLTKFGKPVTLTRNNSGATYDPEAGVDVGGSELSITGVGVLLNYKRNELGDGTIKKTDRKLLFQGTAIEVGDYYGPWRIHDISNLDPDESGTILTTAQMRK